VTTGEKHIPLLRRVLLPWLAVLAWAALIFYVSDQPNLTITEGVWDFILRKGAHVMEFVILGLLFWNAVRQHMEGFGMSLAISSGLAFLYACSDEWHQGFVPGRQAAWRDVAIDSVGIAIAAVAICFLRPGRRMESEGKPAA